MVVTLKPQQVLSSIVHGASCVTWSFSLAFPPRGAVGQLLLLLLQQQQEDSEIKEFLFVQWIIITVTTPRTNSQAALGPFLPPLPPPPDCLMEE